MAEYTLTHTGEEVDAAVEGWQTAQTQADATAADIAEGKKAITKDGLVTGTMDGGGGSSEDNSAEVIEGTIKNYTGDVTKVRDYAFYHSESLESINLPNALTIGNYAFQFAENLLSVILPKATNIGNNAFYGCKKMASARLPAATEIGKGAYRNCENLTIVDLGATAKINTTAFDGCSALVTFIIRTESVCEIASARIFYGSPLYSGSGFFYFPKKLVDAYKSATNWTRFADQIRAIEDYPDIANIVATMEDAA